MPTQIKGIAITNLPTVITNGNNVTGGMIIEIFNQICSKLNVTVVYKEVIDVTAVNSTVPKLVAAGTYDFAIGYPILPTDVNFEFQYQNVSRIDLYKDTLIVFTPNLLQLLVVNVLKELFFVFFIILLPWLLIATTLYYLIDIRRFSKTAFFTGFYEAFTIILYRKKNMPKGAKIYSVLFYIITILIGMLLLGDFIYVIASMLLKSDVDNINDYLNKRSSVCTISHDYLANTFMSNRQEIPDSKAPDPKTCFIQLNSFNVGSFLVSASRIKYFFYKNPSQNNMFDFDIRDSVSVDYYIILSSRLAEFSSQAGLILDDLKVDYIPTLRTKYEAEPVFNRIVPSSIFSDSILLIFTSLTITSLFAIVFLLIIIYRQTKKPSPASRKKSKKKKKHHHPNYDDEKVRLYEMTTKPSEKPYTEEERPHPRDPEVQHIQHRLPQAQNQQPSGKNRTLSLSGPIQHRKFEGNEGAFKFQGASDFENQLSPVPKVEYPTNTIQHRKINIDSGPFQDSGDPGIDLEK